MPSYKLKKESQPGAPHWVSDHIGTDAFDTMNAGGVASVDNMPDQCKEFYEEDSSPDSSWTAVELKAYMDDNGIAYLTSDNKAQLLEKATA
tara:strand:+ start:354 stop:626 length:273 start_codon:yes stop_codon:yes gene_type:complete